MFQLQQVSELYFRLQTNSKTVYQIPEVNYYQTIAYCPKFTELLNRTNYIDYEILPSVSESISDIVKELSLLTVKNILELTPPVSGIIDRCIVHPPDTSASDFINRIECEAFFKVIKSVNGERICYTFMPRKATKYSVVGVASSQMATSVVYQIYIQPNSTISKSNLAFFISSVTDSKSEVEDLNSRPYQARIYHMKSLKMAGVSLFGESIDINRLPYPYDTLCAPGLNRESCYEACLMERFKKIDKLPWSGFYREKLNMKMLTMLDYDNNTI